MKLACLPIESSDCPSIFCLCFTQIDNGLFQITDMLLHNGNGLRINRRIGNLMEPCQRQNSCFLTKSFHELLLLFILCFRLLPAAEKRRNFGGLTSSPPSRGP